MVLEEAEPSVVVDLTDVVSSGVLDVPMGAAGQTAAGPGDGVGLGAVEGGHFQSAQAPKEEPDAVELHGTEGLVLSVGNGVLGSADANGLAE